MSGATAIRTEFGLRRTACGCSACSAPCDYVPGFLVPSDLQRLAQAMGCIVPLDFAHRHLLASPGALVKHRGRRPFRLRTIVPARVPGGACHWLTPEGRCQVHAVAPFWCAFFTTHLTKAAGTHTSMTGLRAVREAWHDPDSLYRRVWLSLHQAGRLARSDERRV